MKCPKCMEKRILDDVPVKNLCPKCGTRWIRVVDWQPFPYSFVTYYKCWRGHRFQTVIT